LKEGATSDGVLHEKGTKERGWVRIGSGEPMRAGFEVRRAGKGLSVAKGFAHPALRTHPPYWHFTV